MDRTTQNDQTEAWLGVFLLFVYFVWPFCAVAGLLFVLATGVMPLWGAAVLAVIPYGLATLLARFAR